MWSSNVTSYRHAAWNICYMSLGLLQFAIFRHLGRADETSAVGSECSCSTGAGARRFDHMTPVLRQLHWLPVRQRVDFKVATLVHRSLSGDAPTYLSDDCHLVADVAGRRLRSADNRECNVARTHSRLGDRAFAAAGPRTWNKLPLNLRRPDLSFSCFRRALKTFLFA